MIKSCYIHIPFCRTICSYCDFCKQFYDQDKVKNYLEKLSQEVRDCYQGEALDTIYIGGGTPTCLDLNELEELLAITDSFSKSPSLEFTMEANVETLTKEKLACMRKHGVNRLSIGIESVQPHLLTFLERHHDPKDIREKISLARQFGFQNINVDLIYAIPHETIEDLKKDLQFILSLEVEHISTYSLILEDHTKLKIHQVQPIDEELDQKMYECIIHTFSQYGYQHYEISNFSKEGYSSKHNLCYWHNEEYYGFGLGAASYIKEVRSCNTRSFSHYPSKKVEEETLTKEDQIEYEVLLNLRLREGLSLNRFYTKYGRHFEDCFDYQVFVKDGLLVEEDSHIKIPEKYWYVSNEILVKILQNKKELC